MSKERRHLRDMSEDEVAAGMREVLRIVSDERYPDRLKVFLLAKMLRSLDVDED